MASPRWSNASAAPIAAAIAAATHHAWDGPGAGASHRFVEALRKMVGPEVFEQVEMTALWLFQQQPRAPEGFEVPPDWAWFTICPGCQRLRRTRYTAPQNGRLKLQVLRDPDWLAARFERGVTTPEIAAQLDCSPSLVADWARKHGVRTPKTARIEEVEATVRRMHAQGEGPGTIAHAVNGGYDGTRIREVLRRLGLATLKNGQVYHDPEWWRVRLEDQGLTANDCARQAGIRQHAAFYWINKFNLRRFTEGRKRRPKYPVLRDPVQLYRLLERHDDNYEKAAEEVGCAPTLISHHARRLLKRPRKHSNELPHSHREWWEERLERGFTTWEMAEEAGVAEKTARERLRVFGLLKEGYRNNYARESGRGKGAA